MKRYTRLVPLHRWLLCTGLVVGSFGCETPIETETGTDKLDTTQSDVPKIDVSVDITGPLDVSDDVQTDVTVDTGGCQTDADCIPDGPCLAGFCDPSGNCRLVPADEGMPCDDGDMCTSATCDTGVCVPGKADPLCKPCASNDECPADTYCAMETCRGLGKCEVRPEACPKDYDPVCGCDGQDYGNACEAASAGVNVEKEGKCACPEILCVEGTEAIDSNGDGCADTCIGKCESLCDCYDNTGIEFEGECPLKCAGCGNYWACNKGLCVQECGFIPDEVATCDSPPTGCKNNDDCGADEYCAKKDGNCGGLGQCSPQLLDCPFIAAPVCGCDGKTYSNSCFAAANGVNVSSDGACDTFCGGIAGFPCADDQWCDPDAGSCNVSDVAGSCVSLENCSKEYAPVCGCDGVTYPTDCARILSQVAKDHDGPCGCEPVVCSVGSVPTDTDGDDCTDSCLPCPLIKCAPGTVATDSDNDGCFDSCIAKTCSADGDCADGEYCHKKTCDAESGKCVAKPQFCTEQYDPVCGCDGKTWGNACEAAAAGQNVAHEGECVSVCGTIVGIACPDGQLCDYEPGSCNVSDNAGVCVDAPTGCPDVWDPVCACDGKTYSNDCERLLAGAILDHEGQCSCIIIIDCAPGYKAVDTDDDGCADSCTPIPCTTSKDCGAFGNLYCEKDGCGDGPGTCAPKPTLCPKNYAPVCGCDGKTYSNACHAAGAGQNVGADGACDQACGGLAGVPCDDGQFCEMDAGTCNISDNQGQCVNKPDACVAIYQPVCGCDGKTYSNDCARQQAGVSKASDGACLCASNDDCAGGSYCSMTECGEGGTCIAKPTKCTKIYAPVCGCDGQTWGNKCFAASAGVSVKHVGACVPDVVTCDTNEDCGDGEYCASADGTCGGGTCEAKPDACALIYKPVCGCDGVTYGNGCQAAAAGVNVSHDGTCESVCGTIDGLQCPDGMWCDPDAGSCNVSDAAGTCESLENCSKEYAPVCGCDGETYPTNCARILAKVAKDHDGPCDCLPIVCGPGSTPADTNGDGCDDACKPCPLILCTADTVPTDTDNDGCLDACLPTKCEDNSHCADHQYCAKDSCDGLGQCVTKPTVCTKEYAPVCGCDGETYSNACHAAAAGVNVSSKGQCKVVCGGFAGIECPDGHYCQQETGSCGSADLLGICVPVPTGCPDIWDPVCGCDGVTYGNECELEAALGQKDHDGTCGCLIIIDCAPGYVAVDTDDDGCADSCKPTPCESSEDCGADYLYCAKSDCDGVGVCMMKPEACTKEYAPVCGCDGETYGNKCLAKLQGATVASTGACETTCGGLAGLQCPDGQFCDYPAGSCGTSDSQGVCVDKPEACVKIYAPVCGCDGITYDNDCFRQLAGAAPSHDGVCACSENWHCADGSFCAKTDGCKGAGQCSEKPTACAKIYAPVCGCDGKTWPNACSANAAGVNVAATGSCDETIICESDADCAEQGVAGYCATAPGNCGGAGTCEEKPLGCPDVWDPVCDCNGVTHSNACDAAQAGASVAYDGECVVKDCEHTAQCADGEFCKKDGCSGVGTCTTPPAICPDNYAPVCGCDGETYANACKAYASSVNVESTGACTEPPCKTNDQCEDGFFCKAAGCGAAGTCAEIPTVCEMVYNPVCGCNGKTYSNACQAAAAGVNVAYSGECEVSVLCESNADCPVKNHYCEKEVGSCGGYGSCASKPAVCPDVYAPVCSCDGLTWGNACEAAAAGANVEHNGECEVVSTCSTNDECADSEYCSKKTGSCSGGGTCEARPTLCPDVYDPVCGCDGQTYGNTCEAAAAGVSVASAGSCNVVCQTNDDCVGVAGFAAKTYCQKTTGNCDGPGKCAAMPDVCPDVYAPVCGCNDQDWSNGCEAAAAGVNVAHEGKCQVVGVPCATSSDCGDNAYCAKETCDGEGTCEPKPTACPDIYDPVCGCDGVTYSNGCEAAAAGATVTHKGECGPGVVLCTDNLDCPKDAYCAFEDGCSGKGTCEPRPTACYEIYAPVCGCDGLTYSNDCYAAAAGITIAHAGACTCPQILCQKPSVPVDTDNDGCADDCQVKCEFVIDCAPGYVAVDTDNDGCDDACKFGCESTCDCYDAKLGFDEPCAALCPTCDNFWTCDAGVCKAACGPVPDDSAQCIDCPIIDCPQGKVPVDTDNDGCDDSCKCKLVPCPVGYTAVDSDNSGCPDSCEKECNVQILCAEGYKPIDSDNDGCDDKCVKICEDILCPTGFEAVDTDNDGCADSCEGCSVIIDCAPGYKPVDTDGDNCADQCVFACESACDCYGEFGDDFAKPCPLDCATCDNFWACEQGICQQECGPVPAEVGECGCVEPVCDFDEVPADKDNDGCFEACKCGPQTACAPGSKAIDTNDNGCFDDCSPVCEPIECPDTKVPADSDNDGCDDVCKCKPIICPMGWSGVDTDNDGCHDTCKQNCFSTPLCPQGQEPVDSDNDGCLDTCECVEQIECPDGQVPADSNNDECADVCVCKLILCPQGQDPVDTDGDDCADTCSGGCKPVVCTDEKVPVDTDGDECADTCVCGLAIDCAPGYMAVDTNNDGCDDSCTCAEAIKCLPDHQAVDSDNNGCPDTCVPANCESDTDCGLDSYFCVKPQGSCDGFGKCVAKDAACDDSVSNGGEVCGCDGNTWPSYCDALSAGVNVASQGACQVACLPIECADGEQAVDTDHDDCPDTCIPANCQKNVECQLDGYFCFKSTGNCDGFGKCISKESECTPDLGADGAHVGVVCGCNGENYANNCEAQAAGVAVFAHGKCPVVACEPFQCPDGGVPFDSDNDSCNDSCQPKTPSMP